MEELESRERQSGQCKHEIDMASFRVQELVVNAWGPAQPYRYSSENRRNA